MLISFAISILLINKYYQSFGAAFLIQYFHPNNFSDHQLDTIWWAFAASKMSHQFFFLHLLNIMMNSSFMSVYHLLCHLHLNAMENHKVAILPPSYL